MPDPSLDKSLREEIAGSRAGSSQVEQVQIRAPATVKTIDDVLAEMMRPYADKVFKFVAWYCSIVGIIVVGDGFGDDVFHLSDTVLGIIAGSTAVSVIGLIEIVVRGLFGARRAKA